MWFQCGEGAFARPCSLPGKHMSEWARESIYPAFQAIDDSGFSNWVSSSMTAVPFAGVTHLLSLALLGGCILMVDLRVLGFGIGTASAQKIEQTVRPLLIAAIAGVLLSGFVLFAGQVLRVYSSPPFWVKMVTLVAALVFTFVVRNRLIDETKRPGVTTKVLGVAAVAAWVFIFLLLTNLKALISALVVLAFLSVLVFLPARKRGKSNLALWAGLGAVWLVAVFLLMRVSLTSMYFGAMVDPEGSMLVPTLVALAIAAALAAAVAAAAIGLSRADAETRRSPVLAYRLAAAASIAMWLTVAAGGRWIAFH